MLEISFRAHLLGRTQLQQRLVGRALEQQQPLVWTVSSWARPLLTTESTMAHAQGLGTHAPSSIGSDAIQASLVVVNTMSPGLKDWHTAGRMPKQNGKRALCPRW